VIDRGCKEKSHQDLLVGILPLLLETYVSHLLQHGLLPRQFGGYLAILPSLLAHPRRAPLLHRGDLISFVGNWIFELIFRGSDLLLDVGSTAAALEFGYEFDIKLLLLLVFYFAHFLVFHALDDF